MKRPRAFALTIALLLLGVVAAAIVALTALLSIDAKTTTRDAQAAQLRQLLVAGAADLKSKVDRGEDLKEQWTVQAPSELGAQVRVEVKRTDQAMQVMVTATRGEHTLRQEIRLQRDANQWRIVAAELGD